MPKSNHRIRVSVGVKYADKDRAKLCGAKFNYWCFDFNYHELVDVSNTATHHTHGFKPFSFEFPDEGLQGDTDKFYIIVYLEYH